MTAGENLVNPFWYSPAEIDTLEEGISAERFSGYVRAAGGDRALAVRLYERNTYLSEAIYGVLQGLELCLRNAIHRRLSSVYGPNWYGGAVTLRHPQAQKLNEAVDGILRQGKLVTPGRVLAELSFGFWTALVGRYYEKRLWVPCLHKAFSNSGRGASGPKLNRSQVSARLESIRLLRNRIAHHEPILHFPLDSEYKNILEAVCWVCPLTASWVQSTSSFPERFARPIA